MATQYKGKNGEVLYPGADDCEASYRIDRHIEMAEDNLKIFGFYLNPSTSDAKSKEFIADGFVKFVEKLDEELSCNNNELFMVGDCLTLSDISLGAFMTRFVLNPHHPHKDKYAAVAKKYPRVWNWSNKTLNPIFKDWFAKQPKGFLNGCM